MKVEQIRSDDFSKIQEEAYQRDLERLYKNLADFVDVKCPACDTDEWNIKFEKYKCSFRECEACETIYMSPRPSPKIMDDYYSNSENYEIWNKYIFPKSEDVRREKICKPNLLELIKVCNAAGFKHPSLVEIGPGFGTFASLAVSSSYFNRVTVIERTPEMVEACHKRGLAVINSSLEDLKELDRKKTADVVVCFEVLEHVYDPSKYLKAVNLLMKKDGIFMFTCPNGKGFDTALLGEHSPAVDTEHVNLFNTNSIQVLLKKNGFQTQHIETPGKLDVDIVKRAVDRGLVDLGNLGFLSTLFKEGDGDALESLQQFLANHSLSGNMRVIARKVDEIL
jgi:2-polyprenyl-3-methyl-5-hydroxy-6-metoxy-1,4-benzoquinol methylase